MKYEIYKFIEGNYILERITESQAVRNIAVRQLLSNGFDVSVWVYSRTNFIGRDFWYAERVSDK